MDLEDWLKYGQCRAQRLRDEDLLKRNTPGARGFAASWTDSSGNLWLFGGWLPPSTQAPFLNDLWEYNPSVGTWTWVSGANGPNVSGTYQTVGTPSINNVPGARGGRRLVRIDSSGNLWLFGGYGYDFDGHVIGFRSQRFVGIQPQCRHLELGQRLERGGCGGRVRDGGRILPPVMFRVQERTPPPGSTRLATSGCSGELVMTQQAIGLCSTTCGNIAQAP